MNSRAALVSPGAARPILAIPANNFDLLRLLLSVTVVFYHSHTLTHAPELAIIPSLFSGDRAVEAFFIVSGFLIPQSWSRSSSWRDYAIKRAFRLYPAYLLVVLLSFTLGSMASDLPWPDFLTEGGPSTSAPISFS